jgi:hypothetical protein
MALTTGRDATIRAQMAESRVVSKPALLSEAGWLDSCSNMTAKHVAWFSFKEGVPADRIQHHLTAVRSLVDLVPEVLAIECGASYTDRAGGLTHCIIVTLPNRAALPRYLDHPSHVPIAEALVADVADLRVMDLDLEER